MAVEFGFAQLPIAVRDWVATEFGAVRVVAEHVGGMSPGCATTLAAADGDMIFVKAVGAELNAQTPTLFRHEMQILAHLHDVPYRTALRGVFDDGDWVALALEHVPGRSNIQLGRALSPRSNALMPRGNGALDVASYLSTTSAMRWICSA